MFWETPNLIDIPDQIGDDRVVISGMFALYHRDCEVMPKSIPQVKVFVFWIKLN